MTVRLDQLPEENQDHTRATASLRTVRWSTTTGAANLRSIDLGL